MEPLDIDWKNIDSIFIRDDLYEHINAPKYIDFSAPEESVDDDAWFCRPDCRHPKNAGDFNEVKHLRSVSFSEVAPLGERNRCRDANLKRRGIAPSEIRRSRKPSKNFREDGENENPNLSSLPSPNGSKIADSRALKSAIKSSAEKQKEKENTPLNAIRDSPKREERVQLKSSNSARNLFSGREIFNQITEIYSELKKLALNTSDIEGSTKKSMGAEGKEKEPLMEAENAGLKEKRNFSTKIFSPEGWKKRMVDDNEKTQEVSAMPDSGSKRKGNRSILQVRSCPPSPQRFPSPHKPPKSRTAKRGILQELEQTPITKSKTTDEEENKSIAVSNEELKPMDMFWFLKPCSYLSK